MDPRLRLLRDAKGEVGKKECGRIFSVLLSAIKKEKREIHS